MAVRLGYQLSSEEHRPNDLVRYAQMAEEHGFTFAAISDHFHPWIDAQGQSPFVWSVIGAIAHATRRLELGTWVTCPTMRLHPAVVAQAAATAAAMMPGRFFLGVGTGENLNEHVVGQGWPETEVRQARLEEAIGIIRLLWKGGNRSHHGRYFRVENARLYTLPEEPPPLLVATGGPRSAEIAGRLGDGLIATGPEADLVRTFNASGGRGKPRYGSVTVCWARDEKSARKMAHRLWPTAAHGELAVLGTAPAPALRRCRQARDRGRRGRDDRLRPRSRQARRGDHEIREGRIRPRHGPPGRTRPGRLFRVLRQGGVAQAEALSSQGRRREASPRCLGISTSYNPPPR